jgi:hypothetical protein
MTEKLPNLKSFLLIAGAFLTGSLLSIFITKTFATTTTGSIHACVKNTSTNPNVRIISPTDTCTSSETALSWDSATTNYFGMPFICQSCDLNPVATKLAGKDFSNSLIKNVALINSNVAGVNFSGSSLENSNFTHSDFTNANLTSSHLFGVNFAQGTFNSVNFTGSDLTLALFQNTQLQNANFTNANLTNAKGMASANLTGAIWANTTCPDGTNSDTHNNTCQGHL